MTEAEIKTRHIRAIRLARLADDAERLWAFAASAARGVIDGMLSPNDLHKIVTAALEADQAVEGAIREA
jgi:hypothetical protein